MQRFSPRFNDSVSGSGTQRQFGLQKQSIKTEEVASSSICPVPAVSLTLINVAAGSPPRSSSSRSGASTSTAVTTPVSLKTSKKRGVDAVLQCGENNPISHQLETSPRLPAKRASHHSSSARPFASLGLNEEEQATTLSLPKTGQRQQPNIAAAAPSTSSTAAELMPSTKTASTSQHLEPPPPPPSSSSSSSSSSENETAAVSGGGGGGEVAQNPKPNQQLNSSSSISLNSPPPPPPPPQRPPLPPYLRPENLAPFPSLDNARNRTVEEVLRHRSVMAVKTNFDIWFVGELALILRWRGMTACEVADLRLSLPQVVAQWTPAQVELYIRSVGFPLTAQRMLRKGVDGLRLLMLRKKDLSDPREGLGLTARTVHQLQHFLVRLHQNVSDVLLKRPRRLHQPIVPHPYEIYGEPN